MNEYQQELKAKIKNYAHLIYTLSKELPDDERFGIISQLRRSSLSVLLNYVEGYARRKRNSRAHFLDIAYASLKESEVLIEFCDDERMLSGEFVEQTLAQADELGAMIYKEIALIESA